MMTHTIPAHAEHFAGAKADAVLSRYPASLGLAELLTRVCRDEGIELLEADQQDIAGVLRQHGGRWTITLSRQDSPDRRQFTLAHLLGHYFLHAEAGRTFVEGVYVDGRCREVLSDDGPG